MPEAPTDIVREIRRMLLTVLWAVIAFLFVWFAYKLLLLAFAGLLLAIILRTFTDWVEKHTGLSSGYSYLVTVCGLVLIFGIIVWLIAPRVVSQATQIAQVIPSSLEKARSWLDRYQAGRYTVQFANNAVQKLDLAGKLTLTVKTAIDAIAGAFIILCVGFYAALHPLEYANGILSLVPQAHRDEAREVGKEIIFTLRWWLLGQLVPMCVLAVLSMLGLWALGVPLAFTLGLLTGVMIFVPFLGVLLSEIPAILVALKVGPRTMVYVVILYLGVHALEAYILTPLVQKRAIRLLPIVTILSQLLMWILTGFLGVAVATPLAATGMVLVKMLYLHEDPKTMRGPFASERSPS